jgi:hypothetical protein
MVISISYDMYSSNDSSMIRVPNISLKTEGGGMFSVSDPGLVVSLQVLPFSMLCKFDRIATLFNVSFLHQSIL